MSDNQSYDKNESYNQKTNEFGWAQRDENGEVVKMHPTPNFARDAAAWQNFLKGKGYGASPSK